MFWVHVLSSRFRNYIYVGVTSDLEGRLHAYQSGWEKTTRAYRPFELVYKESAETRPEARMREKYLKSGVSK